LQQTRTAPFTHSCTPPSFEYPPIDIPEPDSFFWQDYQSAVGEFWQLTDLTTPIMGINPSPSGHWAVVSLIYQEFGYGAYSAFLYVLDTAGNQHWIISEDESDKNTYHWLSDNRIIWIDNGELFLANEDGSARHGVQAPSPVYEVWVGANDIALVSGGEDLWRFSINDETWEKVANIGGVSIPSANLNLSMDGTFAAVNIQGEISIVPLQKGTSAQTFVKVEYPGRDGRIRAPKPIPNTPYWLISEVIATSQNETQPMLLNTQDGSLHSFDEFFPKAAFGLNYSPDGNWIYAWIGGAEKKIEGANLIDLYVAPTTDFTAGKIVFTGVYGLADVTGWEISPPAVLISSYPDSQEVIRVSLDDFGSELIPAPLKFESWQNGIKFLINERVTDETKTFRVEAFSQETEALGSIDLPPNTKRVSLYPVGDSKVMIETRELINQVGDICYYDYHIWQWNVAP